MSCFMNLRLFPFDAQLCPISFYSYAHRDYQIRMKWSGTTPITFPDVELSEFDTGDIYIKTDCVRKYRTGNFSCLEGHFVLKRQLGFYGTFAFLPPAFCVIISWTSLWIKLDIAPARVTLGIATFLTLSSQQSALMKGLPKVPYVKAIDIWMTGCSLFIFATLIEYSIAQVILRFIAIRSCN